MTPWRLRAVAAVVIAIGLAIRIWLVVLGANVSGDATIRYLPIAENLRNGRGFGLVENGGWDPMCSQVPGYPAVLAGVQVLTRGSSRAIVAVQLAEEAAILVLLWAMFRRTPLETAGIVGVGLAWVCPVLALYCQPVSPVSLAALGLIALIYALTRAAVHPARVLKAYVAAGILAGASVWIRVDCLPFIAAAPLLVLWTARIPPRQAGAALLAYVVSAAIVVAPWVARNAAVCGVLQPPGVAQYTQFASGYWRWADTWLDDPRLMDDYAYKVFHADGPPSFPESAIKDPAERSQANELLREMQRGGLNPVVAASVNARFLVLAEGATQRQSTLARLQLRLRRTVLTWFRMPAGAPSVTPVSLKAVWYLLWVSVLIVAGPGVVIGVLRRDTAAMLLALLVGSRTAMPFISAAGAQTHYLVQAVPAVYALAAVGACAMYVTAVRMARGRSARPL